MAEVNVLNDPNLLLEIFQHLRDDWDWMSLSSAARVSQLWFEEATNILWRQTTAAQLALVSADRRQIYAGKMYMMNLLFLDQTSAEHHRSFTKLRFPRLKLLVVQTRDKRIGGWHGWSDAYLQGSLEELKVYGGDLPEDFFDKLDACPRLHTILLEHLEDGDIKLEDFFNFLKRRTSLKSMAFIQNMSAFITDEVFLHLAGRGSLESLCLGRRINHRLLKRLLDTNSKPFPALKRLGLHKVSASAIPLLVRSFDPRVLTTLFLEIVRGGQGVLEAISSLSHLVNLEIEWSDEPIISSASLLSICKLPLQKLSLCSLEKDAEALELTDAQFKTFISSFRHLRSIEFKVPNNLNTAAFFYLATSCRFLDQCDFEGSFDLQELESFEGVAFPELTWLTLASVIPVTVEKCVPQGVNNTHSLS